MCADGGWRPAPPKASSPDSTAHLFLLYPRLCQLSQKCTKYGASTMEKMWMSTPLAYLHARTSGMSQTNVHHMYKQQVSKQVSR